MNLLKRFGKVSDEGQALARGAAGQGLSLFRREIDRAFDRAWGALERDPWSAMGELSVWPAMDLEEDEKAVTVRVDVPGLGPKDIDVEVSGDLLSIKGTRREERTEGNGGGGPSRHERYVGSFTRTVTLPPYADADKVEARYDKGVLTVTVPKVPGEGPKRVEVRQEAAAGATPAAGQKG